MTERRDVVLSSNGDCYCFLVGQGSTQVFKWHCIKVSCWSLRPRKNAAASGKLHNQRHHNLQLCKARCHTGLSFSTECLLPSEKLGDLLCRNTWRHGAIETMVDSRVVHLPDDYRPFINRPTSEEDNPQNANFLLKWMKPRVSTI